MSTSTVSEPAVVLEFTEVLEDYARHQLLLLRFLRAFRTEFLEPGLPAPPSTLITTRAAAQAQWRDDVFGSEVRATRRDYDYFGDLDEQLEQLGTAGASVRAQPGYERTNPTTLWTATPRPGRDPT